MAISLNAEQVEAHYARGPATPPKEAEPYYPGSGFAPPGAKGPEQIPKGTPIPEGVIIEQRVGRGLPVNQQMAVVPPTQPGAKPAPQIAAMPPQGAGRTTIGTFVDVPQAPDPYRNADPVISHTTSNPLVSAPFHPPAGTDRAPEPLKEGEPTRAVDLAKEILDHIAELGGSKNEAAQKFYERSESALRNWINNPGNIPLEAVNRFLAKKPGVMAALSLQLEPHFETHGTDGSFSMLPTRGKTSCVLCAPILERPHLPFLWLCVYLAKKYEMGFEIMADTVIDRSRNMLAHRFLKTGATWSLWVDGDVAVPLANEGWFRGLTGSTTVPDEAVRYDGFERLHNHQKAIIGGVYASRKFRGNLVIQPDVHPRSHEDKLLSNDIRKGTARGLAAVDWIGFGCALIHREVFLEIQRRFQNLAPRGEMEPWDLFRRDGLAGEDEAFCRRAAACGIPIWLDTQLVCGHVGSMAFMPEHTASQMAF